MGDRVKLEPFHLKFLQEDFRLIEKNEAYLEVFGEGYPWIKNGNDLLRYLLGCYGDVEAVSMKRFRIMYDDQLVGQIGLHSFVIVNFTPQAEIFYWIDEKFQGKGIVTTACKLLQQHAFDRLGLEVLRIYCLVANEKSANVAKRCNFQYEGVVKLPSHQKMDLIDYKSFIKTLDQYIREQN